METSLDLGFSGLGNFEIVNSLSAVGFTSDVLSIYEEDQSRRDHGVTGKFDSNLNFQLIQYKIWSNW